ncbi:MAG: hypothetical protein ABIT20_12315 [Gemmatimonadaceae bacterium]
MIPILALLFLSLAGAPSVAQGTSSVCKDGTKSAVSGRGACSSHGGVDAKATEAAAKATKATVTCTDGTSSAGGRGACSSHGGIAKAAGMAKAPSAMTKGPTSTKAPTTMSKPPAADSKMPMAKTDTLVKKAAMSKPASRTAAKAKP